MECLWLFMVPYVRIHPGGWRAVRFTRAPISIVLAFTCARNFLIRRPPRPPRPCPFRQLASQTSAEWLTKWLRSRQMFLCGSQQLERVVRCVACHCVCIITEKTMYGMYRYHTGAVLTLKSESGKFKKMLFSKQI